MEGGVEEEKDIYTYWLLLTGPLFRPRQVADTQREAAAGAVARGCRLTRCGEAGGASSRLAGAALIPSLSGGNERSEPNQDGRGRRACGAGLGCGADSQRVSRRAAGQGMLSVGEAPPQRDTSW